MALPQVDDVLKAVKTSYISNKEALAWLN